MMYGELRVDFFSTSISLNPNKKNRLRLTRARPNFYMISDNPNVSFGRVECSFYTRCSDLKDDYHKKQTDMFVCSPVEYSNLETLSTTIITPANR